MSASEPIPGRLTTVEATLVAEHLLAAFDTEDEAFPAAFLAADRDVLGAVIAYASLGMRQLADRDGVPLAEVRQMLRRHVSQAQAGYESKTNGDGQHG